MIDTFIYLEVVGKEGNSSTLRESRGFNEYHPTATTLNKATDWGHHAEGSSSSEMAT